MIETTERGTPAPWPPHDPVTHARPGLSTVCSLLAILSSVPLALAVLPDRLGVVLPSVMVDLDGSVGGGQVNRMLVVAGAAACLVAPVAAWLSRVLPPWTVLLAGLLAVTFGYWRGEHAASVADIYLVRTLHGAAAGCLLAATAALVGTASARVRPFLAAGWAAALVGTAVLMPRLARTGLGPDMEWQDRLRPYPWLLALAVVGGLALAAASVADRRPRLFPRWIDLAALLPLVAGVPAALIALTLATQPGRAALASVVTLVGAVLAIAVVALLLAGRGGTPDDPAGLLGGRAWSVDGRGAVGSATAVVALVGAVAVAPTVTGLLALRQYAQGPMAPAVWPAGTGTLLGTAVVAGVLAAVAGALLPDRQRRPVIVLGLLAAAVGALALLPAGTGTAGALPGVVLLAGGCGLALGSVLRSVGPLATVVAGGLVAIALPLGEVTRGALFGWRNAHHAGGADGLAEAFEQFRRAAVSSQRLWLVLVAVLLVAGAAVAAVALAISRSRSAGHAR
jgi:hypothetical protein